MRSVVHLGSILFLAVTAASEEGEKMVMKMVTE